MSARAAASARWASFHLFVPGPFEPFLAGAYRPLVEEAKRDGIVRRAFFLRYSEEGHHLRLRFLAARGTSAEALRSLVRNRIGAWASAEYGPGARWRLFEQPYDREALYFGETMESVYAELLNEETSALALRVLGWPGAGERPRRWAAAAGLLDLLLHEAAGGDDEKLRDLAASRAFARHAARTVGEEISAEASLGAPLPSLAAAVTRIGAALARDPGVARTARLLARARRQTPRGGEVAAHALHLLCNKLGFHPLEEHALFAALERLAGASSPTPAGAAP